MKAISGLIFVIFLMGIKPASSQHTNILISDSFNTNEPSIVINPKNPDHMISAANIDNYYYSTDGGYNWQENKVTSAWGVWGDPCVITDTAGYFYYFHLSNPVIGHWIDRIVCQRLDSIGGTWTAGSYMGYDSTKNQDKEWAVVDHATNNIYVTWTQFDDYGSIDPADSSNIMFSRSTDQGQSWSTAMRINEVAGDCFDSDNTVEGAVPTVGPNGEIYVSWAGPAGIVFDRSLDGGNTWLNNDVFVSSITGGWEYSIPGIMRCNGMPVTCCDTSGGPYHGTIYINWSDQQNGTTDTDVWLTKSTDGGNTWSQRARVNDDPPGRQQFFTWMTIDQATGYIYFVFYDRRNYNDYNTDVFMAISKDGGQSFTNFKISESPFIPSQNIFFGDYTNVSAHNNIIRPVWTRLHNGQLSTYTAIVNIGIVGIEEEPIPATIGQNFPNPFSSNTHFSFKLREEAIVSLVVTDVYGRVIEEVIRNKSLQPGKYIESFDAGMHNLGTGVYCFSLLVNNRKIKKQMLFVK